MCEADFLFECYAEPLLQRQPMTVVLGERFGTDVREFRVACTAAFAAHNVTGSASASFPALSFSLQFSAHRFLCRGARIIRR